jgi:hypothetical protein
MADRHKVFLSYPVMDRCEQRSLSSVYRMASTCQTASVQVSCLEGDSLISRVRNVAITMFMDSGADYFMSVDSDLDIMNILPDNNAIDRLIRSDYEFSGALYALKDPRERKSSSVLMGANSIPKFDSGFHEARWLSTGFWMLKRSGVEKMIAAYPELTYDGDAHIAGKKVFGLYIPEIVSVTEADGFKFPPGKLVYRKYLSEDWQYPVVPETLVTMADWTHKQMADVKPGDRIVAFDESSPSSNGYASRKRRMQEAVVLQKHEQDQPTYRIVTDRGSVTCSEAHMWLGRKSSPFTEHNSGNQPGLVPQWMSTLQFAPGMVMMRPVDLPADLDMPLQSDDMWQRGYLAGAWDGDGCLEDKRCRFRVKDLDFVDRVEKLMLGHGIVNVIRRQEEFKKYYPDKNASDLEGLWIYGAEDRARLRELIAGLPASRSWSLGYLAGMLDAEGSYDGEKIEIYQSCARPDVLSRMEHAVRTAGVGSWLRRMKRGWTCTGMDNSWRFFALCQPAIARKRHLMSKSDPSEHHWMPSKMATHNATVLAVEPTGRTETVQCVTTTAGTLVANGFASHNCHRWRQIGGRIWVDSGIHLVHIGKQGYKLWDCEVRQA